MEVRPHGGGCESQQGPRAAAPRLTPHGAGNTAQKHTPGPLPNASLPSSKLRQNLVPALMLTECALLCLVIYPVSWPFLPSRLWTLSV